jgi:1-acyl-sn-glycerol-3-phosphate acyltransferase
MGTYIVLSKLNAAGLKSLKDPDGLSKVAAEVAAMDGKVLDQWATLGPYDLCTFVSAADNTAIHRMAVDQSANGRARFTVLPAIDLPLFVRLLGQTTETTGPHRWQISWWAQVARRALRYHTVTRHVRAACDPFTVRGRDNLDGFKGPAIFIGNHSSHLDALVLHAALPERFRRRLTFGSAADRWFLKGRKGIQKQGWYNSLTLNGFPIKRGGGSASLDHAKWLLDKGWNVVIFPEGTRTTTGKIGKFKHGVALLALEKGVPVVPVFMGGLRELRPKGSLTTLRGPATAAIGNPIHFAPGTSVADATHEMYAAMEALRRSLRPARQEEPATAVAAEATA